MQTEIIFNGRVPSLKNARRIVRLHGRLITIPSLAWAKFERFVKQEYPKRESPIEEPYEIEYKLYLKGKGFQDFDNIIAGINDLLQKLNYITDDRHIHRATVTKIIGADEYLSKVSIKNYAEEGKSNTRNRKITK